MSSIDHADASTPAIDLEPAGAVSLETASLASLSQLVLDKPDKWETSIVDLEDYYAVSSGKIYLSDDPPKPEPLAELKEGEMRAMWSIGKLFERTVPTVEINGHVFPLHESILLSASFLSLQGTTLRGICTHQSGTFRESSIDLNNHYSNDQGKFSSGGGNFAATGWGFSIDAGTTSVMLKGTLGCNRGYVPAEVDISVCVLVKDGRFVFERHDGFWGRDGWMARKFERLPVTGFLVSFAQWIAGNPDHAARALALCSKSSMVAIGVVIGNYFGGPIGAMIGGGIMAPVGVLVETSLSGLVTDPRLQAEFEEATIGRYIYEVLRGAGVGLTLGALEVFLAVDNGPALERVLKEVVTKLEGPTSLTGQDVMRFMFKIKMALEGNSELLEQWDKTTAKVRRG